MSEVLKPLESQNPIKDGIIALIESLRNTDISSITSIWDFPKEILQQIWGLEKLKVDFSNCKDLSWVDFLKSLKQSCGQYFNGSEDVLRQVTSVLPQEVTETLELSSKAQEKTQALETWIKENSDYAEIGKIKENVSVKNDGLHIETSLWVKTLAWKWHTFGGVNTLGENLSKQKYTIEEMWAIIEALGGKKPSDPLKDWEKIGWSEISSFLSKVAGVELWRFFWSSSEHANFGAHAWGLGVSTVEVFVDWTLRDGDGSSLASQN